MDEIIERYQEFGVESSHPEDDFARWVAEKRRKEGHVPPVVDIKPGTLREFMYLCSGSPRR